MGSWASASVEATPWEAGDACAAALTQRLPFDAVLAALFDDARPRADELLLARRWSGEQLRSWCEPTANAQKLFAAAKRQGGHLARAADLPAGDPLRRMDHLMVQVLPTDTRLQRWWCLCLARRASAFTWQEQQMAALTLRHWQVCFDHVTAADSCRLLLGQDDRLIHADPLLQMRLLKHPDILDRLLETLHPVRRQRWPKLADGQTHDFVVELPDTAPAPSWVRFRRNRAAAASELPGGEHWLLEIHGLAADELPAVGAVEDERIAGALAYIHDHYQEAPSLTEVAHAVHVSPFHFHRLFSRAVGLSPKQYLQRKQLQVAKWLLTATRRPIGDIAARTGFASHGHFTSTFHRTVGVSPTDFREGQTDGKQAEQATQPQ